MTREERVARAAYLYWVTRGDTLSAARLRAVQPWEDILPEPRSQWLALARAVLDALDEAD